MSMRQKHQVPDLAPVMTLLKPLGDLRYFPIFSFGFLSPKGVGITEQDFTKRNTSLRTETMVRLEKVWKLREI